MSRLPTFLTRVSDAIGEDAQSGGSLTWEGLVAADAAALVEQALPGNLASESQAADRFPGLLGQEEPRVGQHDDSCREEQAALTPPESDFLQEYLEASSTSDDPALKRKE